MLDESFLPPQDMGKQTHTRAHTQTDVVFFVSNLDKLADSRVGLERLCALAAVPEAEGADSTNNH